MAHEKMMDMEEEELLQDRGGVPGSPRTPSGKRPKQRSITPDKTKRVVATEHDEEKSADTHLDEMLSGTSKIETMFAALMSSSQETKMQMQQIREVLVAQKQEISEQVQRVDDKVDAMREEMDRELKKAHEKTDRLERDVKGLMQAQFTGEKVFNTMPPPTAPSSSASAETCTMVMGNFSGRELQDKVIEWLRDELRRRDIHHGEIFGKARRPTIMFVEMRGKNELYKAARAFRTTPVRHDSGCEPIWASLGRPLEERLKLKPIAQLCAAFRSAYTEKGHDVEVTARGGIKNVLCTFDEWKNEFTIGRMKMNEQFEVLEETIKGFDRGEAVWAAWKAATAGGESRTN